MSTKDFVEQPLDKQMNKDNILDKITALQQKMQGNTSASVEALSEISVDLGGVASASSGGGLLDDTGAHISADDMNIDWWLPLTTNYSSDSIFKAVAVDETNGYVWFGGILRYGHSIGGGTDGLDAHKAALLRLDLSNMTWTAHGEEFDNSASPGLASVEDIKVATNGDVYFGGAFDSLTVTTGGGQNLAYYDLSADNFVGLGTGISDAVYNVELDSNDNIYINTGATNIGGITGADYVAYYDGSWNMLGTASSFISRPYNIWLDSADDYVYAAGAFTNVGGNADIDYITVWNGSYFDIVGDGTMADTSSGVVKWNGELFVSQQASPTYDYVYKWDDVEWTLISSQTGGSLTDIDAYEDGVLLMGTFTAANGEENTAGICEWNGDEIAALNRPGDFWTGLDAGVNAATADDTRNIWVAGSMSFVGAVKARSMAVRARPLSLVLNTTNKLIKEAASVHEPLIEAISITTADFYAYPNRHYYVDLTGLTAIRNFLLPPANWANVGDEISITINAGDADYELNLKPDTNAFINSAAISVWSKLFITGETVTFKLLYESDPYAYWWVVHDGRIPCVAQMDKDTAQSIPSTTTTKVNLDQTNIDNSNGMCDTTNHKIWIRRDGYYQVTGRMSLQNTIDYIYLHTDIYVNGSNAVRSWNAQSVFSPATLNLYSQVTRNMSLSAGDYLELYTYQNTGASKDTAGADINEPFLELHEII